MLSVQQLNFFFKENSVLREVLAEEISRRVIAENDLENCRKELKQCKLVIYAISNELTKTSRKEELVKSLRIIINRANF